MYNGYGIIKGNKPGQKPGWYYVSVAQEFANYYNYLYNKFQKWNTCLNGPHITFIAGEKEGIEIPCLDHILGNEIEFMYDTVLHTNGKAFWFQAESTQLDQIREKAGLGKKRFGYHITLGNYK